jgi:hypothetical protein
VGHSTTNMTHGSISGPLGGAVNSLSVLRSSTRPFFCAGTMQLRRQSYRLNGKAKRRIYDVARCLLSLRDPDNELSGPVRL